VSSVDAGPVVTILNCAAEGLNGRSVFGSVRERLRLESANGAFWPVILECKSRRWRDYKHITVGNEVINSLVSQVARLFDITKLPLVFKNRPTMYDDEDCALEK
jgi:hypothetical protein